MLPDSLSASCLHCCYPAEEAAPADGTPSEVAAAVPGSNPEDSAARAHCRRSVGFVSAPAPIFSLGRQCMFLENAGQWRSWNGKREGREGDRMKLGVDNNDRKRLTGWGVGGP